MKLNGYSHYDYDDESVYSLKNGGKPRKYVLFEQGFDIKRKRFLVDQFNKNHVGQETEIVSNFEKLVEMVANYTVREITVYQDDVASLGMILQICGILETFGCRVVKIGCDMQITDWTKYDLCGMSGLMRLCMGNQEDVSERDKLSCCIRILEM